MVEKQTEETEVVAEEGEVLMLENEMTNESSEDVVLEKEVEKVQEWTEVSTGKSSCSPITRSKELEYAKVTTLTNSRFSVLSSERRDK